PATYAVRHIVRFPLGTAYTAVCQQLVPWFQAPPLAGSTLVVDQTGVGRPVVDLLRTLSLRCRLVPIAITGGHRATPAEGGWLVPKKELVSSLQVLLQARRLQVAR